MKVKVMGIDGTGLISRIGKLFRLHDPRPADKKGDSGRSKEQKVQTVAERISSELLKQMGFEGKGKTIDLHG
ncbi:TPA: hypothetical protein EYP37_13010 [Candidatus Poribacteria bacterium]|nr:hypothetical protein [Candidatus Poribacteria bacterium]